MVDIAGKKLSKSTVLLAGGGVGLVAFLWWRHSMSASTAAATPTATDTSSADYSSDPYAIDPTTGVPYSQESGYGSGFGSIVGNPSYPSTVTAPGSFTSNAQWAQWAEQDLAGIVDPTALSAALGKYLTGQPMTSDQGSLADQAIAVAGYPPVAGPGGFPPSMHTTPSTGQTGGGGTGSVLNAPTLSATGHKGFADFGWSTVSGASVYELKIAGPTGYDHVVSGTHARVTLKAGSYTVSVRAGVSSADIHGHWSSVKSFKVS